MEQVAPVALGKAKWFGVWPLVAALLVLAGVALHGPMLWWALSALVAAPLAVLAAVGLLVLPGLALLRLLRFAPLSAAERWPLAVGVSCALPPLLLLVSEPLGVRWNAALCWAYVGLALVVVVWPRRVAGRVGRLNPPATQMNPAFAGWSRLWQVERPHMLLIGITLVALLVRLYAARDLPVGMFGDSYHHTVIAQLIVDHGGLFSSWQPYAPLTTLTYHYGFHSTVAWFSLLSGVPVTRSLVLVGQVESALAAPMVYLLARRTLRNEAAALWAALLVGVINTLPGYYVNWGRYTQLAGQTILPAACVIWMALLDSVLCRPIERGGMLRLLALTVIVTAGMTLTHYRIAVFAACFVVAYGLWLLVANRRWTAFVGLAVAGGVAGGLTGLVVLPWLLRLRQGALLKIGNQMVSKNMGSEQTNAAPASIDVLALHARPYLVVLALCGAVLLARAGARRGLVLVAWAAVVVLAANPYVIGLNGAGILTNFAALIANYLVLAPLAGAALALGGAWAASRWNAARPVALAQVALGATLALGNLGWQAQIVDPRFQLFTTADAKAMDWIKRELPVDANVFVNSFGGPYGGMFVGTDGGWWVAFMTGRHTNMPPLTYGSEAGERPGYLREVIALNAAIQQHPLETGEAAAALKAAGFTYLYNGPAAEPGDEYVDPNKMKNSRYYKRVYRSREGVTIWQVR